MTQLPRRMLLLGYADYEEVWQKTTDRIGAGSA